jgi:hypothetical protein
MGNKTILEAESPRSKVHVLKTRVFGLLSAILFLSTLTLLGSNRNWDQFFTFTSEDTLPLSFEARAHKILEENPLIGLISSVTFS